ncbi:MAG: endolytic transglycosylase MltG [Bacteroidales bacterium]|nr:endolytic transglycosylase MltG [Bacteroidales bacterium]
MTKKSSKAKNQKLLIAVGILAGVLLLLALFGRYVLKHQQLPIDEEQVILVPSGSSYDALCDSLRVHNCITSESMFQSMAHARKLNKHVKAGRYVMRPGMTTMRMVNKLYYGNQDALKLTINRYRTNAQFAAFIGKRLEMDGDNLLAMLNSEEIAARYGFTPATILGMFVQNSYDIYWTIEPQKFLDKMYKEYNRFWNGTRKAECEALGLTPQEVTILASIVDEETNKNDEKAKIASVYLNRLHRGMLLQADPTVKYAVGDFTLRRILLKHLATPSPYNTYLYKGLPPGPICLPSVASIDAVLANLPTKYLYFCAKEDFSGYHNFAETPAQHAANAARFHAAMNARKIYK